MQASGNVFLVKVEWQVGRYKEQLWAELDTGFSGGLVLPATRLGELISRLGYPDGENQVELANGSPIRVPYYIGSVSPIGSGQHIPCHIYLVGHKALVGLKVLESLNIVPDILQVLGSKGIVVEWEADP
jgi:predicted aspartyl protease